MIGILVADRSGAKLFKCTGNAEDVVLIQEFEYPEGRRQNHDIDSDTHGTRFGSTAGRSGNRAGFGPASQTGHGLDPHIEAVEHLSDIFARDLALILKQRRTHNEFDELALIAEPGFLGKLRRSLDVETAKRVTFTVNRDLSNLPVHEMIEQVGDQVVMHRRVA